MRRDELKSNMAVQIDEIVYVVKDKVLFGSDRKQYPIEFLAEDLASTENVKVFGSEGELIWEN